MDYIILFLYSICKCLFSNNCCKNKFKKLLKKGSKDIERLARLESNNKALSNEP